MRIGIEYSINRVGKMVLVNANFSILHTTPMSTRTQKDNVEYIHWIVFPEWCKKGVFFLPVKDFTKLNNIWYKEYYELSKDKNDEFIYEIITKKKNEIETSISTQITNVKLNPRFDDVIMKENFTMEELVRQKKPAAPEKVEKRRTKKALEFEEEF